MPRKVTTIDYNGPSPWSAEDVIRRYREYAKDFGISPLREIKPEIHEQCDRRWIYPVMNSIIDGIEDGDLACAQIGIEFIEEDQSFAFGAILKSNTARALRRFPALTDAQISRIRKRVVEMLRTGRVPREYRQYSRLLRRIGLGDTWPLIATIEAKNHYAARALEYFRNHCAPRINAGD